MADFLDNLDDVIDTTGKVVGSINKAIKTDDFNQNGFMVPATPGADGNGLPSSKIINQKLAQTKRSIIHWFVPEFGVVKMYVNPNKITYTYKKDIKRERTKGGYTLQYWGEELPQLHLSGTTGRSGIEGINVLYEIYRAEQLAFDAVGLTLAADNAAQGAADQIIDKIGGSIGGPIAKSILGTDSAAQALSPKNLPSLAQFAFGVEMFYQGWVHRGYFDSMNFTESASNVGMFEYDMVFFVTERRGYRSNYLPWHRSAIDGASGDNIPYSFSRLLGE